ncbi:MAG: class I SAM-dependent methyltransferase [Thermodesulfobacteriota bacterium]|nr:class I SAM-dependent methyltransferase [Thermodesulfobacteriota bacterium]
MNKIRCQHTVCALCGEAGHTVAAKGYDYQYGTTQQPFCFVKCIRCGHLYLNPRPVSESITSIYPVNYYTKDARHSGMLVGVMKRLVIRRRLFHCNRVFQKQARILELGCGDCALLVDIKTRYPWCRVKGVDIAIPSQAMLRGRALQIDLVQANAEEVPLEEGAYDLIIMNQLLEHLQDPVRMLHEIQKALKPGGLISIETPNFDGYDRRLFNKSFWGGYYFPRHFHLFNTSSLKALLQKNGFVIVKQAQLVAPIIWIFSLGAVLEKILPGPRPQGRNPGRLLSDRNPVALGIFTLVDLLAIWCGAVTSNQKIIAQKS